MPRMQELTCDGRGMFDIVLHRIPVDSKTAVPTASRSRFEQA